MTGDSGVTLYGIWYSDYSNSSCAGAVYESRDNAEAVARETGGDLIEFTLNPPLSEKAKMLIRPGERVYTVAMNVNGDDAQAWAQYSNKEPDSRLGVRVDRSGQVARLSGETWAASEKHAIKIINERRARWIAIGKPTGKPVKGYSEAAAGWRTVILT